METKTEIAVVEAAASITDTAKIRMARAASIARDPFILAGHHGSSAMELAQDEALITEFGAIARDMIVKAREYDPLDPGAHAEVIETALQKIADAAIFDREEKAAASPFGKSTRHPNFQEALKRGMHRALKGAIRDLKHQKLQITGAGTYVAVSQVTGNVNVAVDRSSATQNNQQVDVGPLIEILANFRNAANDPTVSAHERTSIIEHVEEIEGEIAKPEPSAGRIKRIGKWLGDKATGAAFSAAAGQLATWLASLP